MIARFFSHVIDGPRGCLIWIGATRNGYGNFKVEGVSVYTHRFIFEALKGPIPPKLDVCHTCDVPLCVNVDHLVLGTRKVNMEDAVRKGRIARGAGVSHYTIGSRFGISDSLVSLVANRKRWGHVA